MLEIALSILVAALICGLAYAVIAAILRLLPVPPPFGHIVLAVVLVIFLFWVLNIVGLTGGSAWRL